MNDVVLAISNIFFHNHNFDGVCFNFESMEHHVMSFIWMYCKFIGIKAITYLYTLSIKSTV